MNRHSFLLLWLCGSALTIAMGVPQAIANPAEENGAPEQEFKVAQIDDREDEFGEGELEESGELEGEDLENFEGLGAEIEDSAEGPEDLDAVDLVIEGEEDAETGPVGEPLASPSSTGAERGTTEAAPEEAIAAPELRDGFLRVGNRTPYPLRVVVLVRDVTNNPSNIPAHWDFAPGEGGSEGLALSIREREPLVVGPGDIIVAFSIDGSRRYWGPNVVDETLAPFWNNSDRSWTMILQP